MFAGDLSNYYIPSDFVNAHRSLQSGNRVTTVAMNNYVMPTFPGIPALQSASSPNSSDLSANQKGRTGAFRWSRYDDLNPN
jgi:hypothetical protein